MWARLARTTAAAAAFCSTKSAHAAPRDSASIPMLPVPAYRSSTRSGATPSEASTEKSAPLILSAIGRVPGPAGPFSLKPFASPAITRTAHLPSAALGDASIDRHPAPSPQYGASPSPASAPLPDQRAA